MIGNEHIFNFFDRLANARKLSGFYIFSGPDGLGKTAAAFWVLRRFFCTEENAPCGKCKNCNLLKYPLKNEQIPHPDAFLLTKNTYKELPIKPSGNATKRDIGVSSARLLIERLSVSPVMGLKRAAIIKDGEILNPSSANCLLKTFEEPRPDTLIILTVNNLDKLLPTIISRGQIIRFRSVNTTEVQQCLINRYGIDRIKAQEIAGISLGRPALAVKLAQDAEFYEHKMQENKIILKLASRYFYEKFSAVDIIEKVCKNEDKKINRDKVLDFLNGLQIYTRDLVLSQAHRPDLRLNRHADTQDNKTLLQNAMFIENILRTKEIIHNNGNFKTALGELIFNNSGI